MQIGKRLKKLRNSFELSRKEMSRDVVSYSHYCNYETGNYIPPDDILAVIADKLNISADYLLNYQKLDIHLDSIYQESLFFLLQSCYLYKSGNKNEAFSVFTNELLPLIEDAKIEDLPQEFQNTYYNMYFNKGLENKIKYGLDTLVTYRSIELLMEESIYYFQKNKMWNNLLDISEELAIGY